jgi:hypothetical protein
MLIAIGVPSRLRRTIPGDCKLAVADSVRHGARQTCTAGEEGAHVAVHEDDSVAPRLIANNQPSWAAGTVGES